MKQRSANGGFQTMETTNQVLSANSSEVVSFVRECQELINQHYTSNYESLNAPKLERTGQSI